MGYLKRAALAALLLQLTKASEQATVSAAPTTMVAELNEDTFEMAIAAELPVLVEL